ncbi:MAG: hypothetical protein ACPGES_07725 [Coraliomargarita sp.]
MGLYNSSEQGLEKAFVAVMLEGVRALRSVGHRHRAASGEIKRAA